MIADHLLGPLLGEADEGKAARPEHWIVAALVVAVLALSGPSFGREEAPFAEDRAALVVVLEVTESMTNGDVAPSRLERATHKLRDLLDERTGGRTALVAFAGSAHVVLPLTRDARILTRFAEGLEPDVMPRDGEAPADAIAVADALLAKDGAPGSIVVLSDGFPADRLAPLAERRGAPVHVLGIASAPVLAQSGLEAAASSLGGSYVALTPDASDVRTLARAAERSVAAVAGDDGGARRSDHGYFLLPLFALLVLPWMRRGWSVDVGGVAAVVLACLLPACGADAWERPERRAVRLIADGQAREAADVLTDPMWRGVALYRAGEFAEAAEAFALLSTAEAHYDRGTALVMAGKYEDAVEAYDQALVQRPGWAEAEDNREIARLRAERLVQRGGEGTGGKLGADDVVAGSGEKQEIGSETVELGAEGPLDDEGVRALWLRNVQTKPADFLRWKFSHQVGERSK